MLDEYYAKVPEGRREADEKLMAMADRLTKDKYQKAFADIIALASDYGISPLCQQIINIAREALKE